VPSVRDPGLARENDEDLMAAGLRRDDASVLHLRDPDRLVLLTPAGRLRALAIARGGPSPRHRALLSAAEITALTTASSHFAWSGPSTSTWQSWSRWAPAFTGPEAMRHSSSATCPQRKTAILPLLLERRLEITAVRCGGRDTMMVVHIAPGWLI